jgi:transcriptional regulator with GAF, ATPase, and Fis domain
MSLASVPLYSQDTIIGALNVENSQRHAFSHAEKKPFIAIGNEAGAVVAKLRADESVQAALKENEMLFKEIHYRAKNNMQIASSLLSLQSDRAATRRRERC